MKKIRVGILGGSFNPCHSGHLHISLEALKRLDLKEVWWVVSPQNPLKKDNIQDSFLARVKKCEEFTKDQPQIKVSDIEQRLFRNSKKFYTYKLLERLNKKFRDIEFVLLIGADNLATLHKWKNYKKLPELAEIAVFDRGDNKHIALNSKAAKQGLYDYYVFGKKVNISSTEIRNKKK